MALVWYICVRRVFVWLAEYLEIFTDGKTGRLASRYLDLEGLDVIR